MLYNLRLIVLVAVATACLLGCGKKNESLTDADIRKELSNTYITFNDSRIHLLGYTGGSLIDTKYPHFENSFCFEISTDDPVTDVLKLFITGSFTI
jgi:hypothetical protein